MSFSTKRSFSRRPSFGGTVDRAFKVFHQPMQCKLSQGCFLFFSVRRAAGITLNVTQGARRYRSGYTFTLVLTCSKDRSRVWGSWLLDCSQPLRVCEVSQAVERGMGGQCRNKPGPQNYLHCIDWSFCFRIKNFFIATEV